MIFVDTNVFMYAVGREHPLRAAAREFFEKNLSRRKPEPLCTSAEVLQELMHAYLPVSRIETLDAALELVFGTVNDVFSIEAADVQFARDLVDQHPGLGARDLLHFACCSRRRVDRIQTFDRTLAAAFAR